MGLAEEQAALARLYTDQGWRERFFANPQEAGVELGLEAEGIRRLADLSAPLVGRFAASLQHKRRAAVARLLPLTCRELGDRFAELFALHAAEFVPQGTHMYREDALAFAAFLARQRVKPLWLGDLAGYEAGSIKAQDPAVRLHFGWFSHPVARLRIGPVSELPRRATLGLWLRLPWQRAAWHQVLELPWPPQLLWLLLVAMLTLGLPADAQEATPLLASTAPVASATPSPIAMPDVAAQAAAVASSLGEMETSIVSLAKIAAIKQNLQAIDQELRARMEETTQLLQSAPSVAVLRDLATDWRSFAGELPAWKKDMVRYATDLESDLTVLSQMHDTWEHTQDLASRTGAPTAVLDNVDATLAEIDRVRESIASRRSQILTVQSQITLQETRVSGELHLIQQANDTTISRLLGRESPPLWSDELHLVPGQDILQGVIDSVMPQFTSLNKFIHDRGDRIPIQVLIFVLLLTAFMLARGGARRRVKEHTALAPAGLVFEMPIAAALLLSILSARWIYPHAPRVLGTLFSAAALLPTVYILRRLVTRPLFPLLYALIVFYFVDRVRDVAAAFPAWERLIYQLEMLGGIAFTVWLLSRNVKLTTPERAAPSRAMLILRLALAVFVAAFLANAFGCAGLAHYLGDAVLGCAYNAVILYAGMRVANDLVTFALLARPLRLLGMVQRHADLIRIRLQRAIRWLAILTWFTSTLSLLDLRSPLQAAVRDVLQAQLDVGFVHVSARDVLLFGLTVGAAFWLSRFIRFVLEEDIYPHVELESGVPYTLSRVLHYAIMLIGFLVALAALGVNLDRFTVLTGAFGIGAGFGLQSVISNFVSGLILLFERPVKVGDWIEMDSYNGTIMSIGIRASVLRTTDGAEIIVPNASLISSTVKNWTLSDRQRRIEIPVGVAYDTDMGRVIELLNQVAASHPLILTIPPPLAEFSAFGESSLDFKLRAWTDHFDQWQAIRSDLGIMVASALRENRIEIPFPQRDVHLQREDPGSNSNETT